MKRRLLAYLACLLAYDTWCAQLLVNATLIWGFDTPFITGLENWSQNFDTERVPIVRIPNQYL